MHSGQPTALALKSYAFRWSVRLSCKCLSPGARQWPTNVSLGCKNSASARYWVQTEESAQPEVAEPAARAAATVGTRKCGALAHAAGDRHVGGGRWWIVLAEPGVDCIDGRRTQDSVLAVDLLLWASGSKKTFGQGLQDTLKRPGAIRPSPIRRSRRSKRNLTTSTFRTCRNPGMVGRSREN